MQKERTLVIPDSILKAENMTYNNTNSGLSAKNVQEAIDEIVDGEITEEELMQWYDEIVQDTGVPNSEIDKIYEENISYEGDTGLSNELIDEMYE